MKQKKQSFVNCRLKSAELVNVDMLRVSIESSHAFDENNWFVSNQTGKWPLVFTFTNGYIVELRLTNPYLFSEENYVVHGDEVCYIEVTDVVRTEAFDQLFYYSGDDLGVVYSQGLTTFAIWAPTATKVNVLTFSTWHEDKGEIHACFRDEKGVWRTELSGNKEGTWYLFEVYVNQEWRKVVDPYAKFLGVNGQKAMVGDLKKTELSDWPILTPLQSNNDVIIYELHIRDFTIGRNNGITHKGKYIGLTEEGTLDLDQRVTGLDYLERLGITHVELLPVQEYGSVDESDRSNEENYNWGYDTTHFFVPEGSYASDPYNGYSRIRELKALIASLHQRQLRVIMDVVFNHIYIREESPLELIVPGYYFRYTEDNEISNATGVGNDFASERKMARKIIVDAITYWLTEFKVDGFRFDLMGILDLETMKQVMEAASKVKEDVFLLGEGWDLPTAYPQEKRAITDNARSLQEISFFQDKFRDGMKGSTFEISSPGFISGDSFSIDEIVSGVKGSMELFTKPRQAINYVEAHDNHTLWDKLKQVHPTEDRQVLQKRHKLATSIVLLSQGIPFLHAGQEWFRTKHGTENSYNQPDWVNQFSWEQRAYFEDAVTYTRGLIKLRRAHPAFRIASYKTIKEHFHLLFVESDCIAYHLRNLNGIDRWHDIIVIHNASLDYKSVRLPNNNNWYVVVDDRVASLIPLSKIGEDCALVSPISTFVCVNYV
ncbi:type I pullulanase [Halalkalibacter lacteus]|uniref:type I pullulanase n=1 Tax=Halalkalibacter lacteus TaxID=3090663 RepID=UPI002FC952B7